MSNALRVLFPYRDRGQWMFDDPATGLVREPFVAGIDTMLDRLSEQAGVEDPTKGVKIVFSQHAFPGAMKLEWTRGEGGGNWYKCPDMDDMEGWLCPALHQYFEQAPRAIYWKLEKLKPEDARAV